MRKIPLGRFALTGLFPSRRAAKPLQFESGLERNFLAILESETGIRTIATQQPTLEVTVDGVRRRYTPDVLVTWRDERRFPFGAQTVAFEVKPYSELKRKHSIIAPKLRVAKQELQARGIGFRVITDRSIRGPRLQNAFEINRRHAYQPREQWYNAASEHFAWSEEPFALGDLVRILIAAGAREYEAWDSVWHWIGQKAVECDVQAPISIHTRALWWTMITLKALRNDKKARNC